MSDFISKRGAKLAAEYVDDDKLRRLRLSATARKHLQAALRAAYVAAWRQANTERDEMEEEDLARDEWKAKGN